MVDDAKHPPPEEDEQEPSASPDPPDAKRHKADVGGTKVEEFMVPDWPCNVLIIAQQFSGKTNATLHLMALTGKEYFDNIWVVTASGHTGNLSELVPDEDFILEELSEEFLTQLLQHQKETNAKTLIIFDDFVGMSFNPKNSKMMNRIASAGRNFNLSTIFSSQDIIAVPTMFRRNAAYLFFGDMTLESIEIVVKKHATATMPSRVFKGMLFDIAKRKDYRFLCWDSRKKDYSVCKAPLLLKK